MRLHYAGGRRAAGEGKGDAIGWARTGVREEDGGSGVFYGPV